MASNERRCRVCGGEWNLSGDVCEKCISVALAEVDRVIIEIEGKRMVKLEAIVQDISAKIAFMKQIINRVAKGDKR